MTIREGSFAQRSQICNAERCAFLGARRFLDPANMAIKEEL